MREARQPCFASRNLSRIARQRCLAAELCCFASEKPFSETGAGEFVANKPFPASGKVASGEQERFFAAKTSLLSTQEDTF
jgi:hypothetical protein